MPQLTLPPIAHPACGPGLDRIALLTTDVRRGDVGIFAGDWTWTDTDHGRRQPVGYLGILEDDWDGYAVFSCTRDVAEAVVANHRQEIDALRERMRRLGHTDDGLDYWIAANATSMTFDREDIVVDERGLRADLHAFRRIKPEHDGRYVINGYQWTWITVDPTDCDTIIGDWPIAL